MAIINITAYFTEILVFLISSKLFKVGLFRKASDIKSSPLYVSYFYDSFAWIGIFVFQAFFVIRGVMFKSVSTHY